MITGRIYRAVRRLIPGGRRRPRMAGDTLWTAAFLRWIGMFYRFMPELIYEGHVYIAMPPLYKAMPSRGKEEYLYDDKALEKYRKTHKEKFTLQRYKGLGEMDPEQLWETTLNPETRLLKRVEIEDARMASDVTEVLMGTEVPPRKAFIYEHATDAELDI